MIIKPQEGYQENALCSNADIVIGGGAAGVGKTFCLLMEPVRHLFNKENFKAIFFRRTSVQIRDGGGLWDESLKLYTRLPNAESKDSTLLWDFGKDNSIKFSHLEYEKDIYQHQGKQYALICFDELTHFTEKMFFYMLSRNRSVCGVKPYVRCTTNPDPDSWVAKFIEWWIDQSTGLPIPERNAKVRYFARDGNSFIWGNSIEEVYQDAKSLIDPMINKAKAEGLDNIGKDTFIKSVSFIGGSIYDNKALLSENPEYLGNLSALPEAERAILLDGNWKVRLSGTELFDYDSFKAIFENENSSKGATRYITADLAFHGSDLFPIYVWEGYHLLSVEIVERCDGKDAVSLLNRIMMQFGVQGENVLFDADGVGQGITGWINGAVEFHNGAKALNDENYLNLKNQVFFKCAENIKSGLYSVSKEVSGLNFSRNDEQKNFREELLREQRAIKRDKVDHDGKKRIQGKDKVKEILKHSPDLIEAFVYREYFNLKPERKIFVL